MSISVIGGAGTEYVPRRKAVGRDPGRFEDFVKQVAPAWKGRAAGYA